MVTLSNEIQTMFSFPMTIKYDATMCLNLIGESNVVHLSNYTQILSYFYVLI